MKHILLITTLLLFSVTGFTQGLISFGYDANGNRTATVLSSKKSQGESNQKEETASELATPTPATATHELAGLKLTLYPNPTKGHFSISVDNADDGTHLQAVLYTSTGTVVSRKTLADCCLDFNLSGNAAGVYLLHIEAGGETRIWKVIKH